MLLLSNVIVARFELDGKSIEVRGRQTQSIGGQSGLIKCYYNSIIIQCYYCKFYNELDDGKSVEEGRDKAVRPLTRHSGLMETITATPGTRLSKSDRF